MGVDVAVEDGMAIGERRMRGEEEYAGAAEFDIGVDEDGMDTYDQEALEMVAARRMDEQRRE